MPPRLIGVLASQIIVLVSALQPVALTVHRQGILNKSDASDDRPVILLGLGAMKSATSFFTQVLLHTEALDMGDFKELHYLDGSMTTRCPGKQVNGNIFEKYVSECMGGKLPGEGRAFMDMTVQYGNVLSCAEDAGADADQKADRLIENLHELSKVANVRFVMLIRDPVERLISQLDMFLDPDPQYDAVRSGDSRNSFSPDMSDSQVSAYITDRIQSENKHRFICTGYYHRILERLLNEGFALDQMLIIEHTAVENVQTYQDTLKLIGAPQLPDDKIKNMIFWTAREPPRPRRYELPAKLRSKLEAHYKPHNDALRDLLPWISELW